MESNTVLIPGLTLTSKTQDSSVKDTPYYKVLITYKVYGITYYHICFYLFIYISNVDSRMYLNFVPQSSSVLKIPSCKTVNHTKPWCDFNKKTISPMGLQVGAISSWPPTSSCPQLQTPTSAHHYKL